MQPGPLPHHTKYHHLAEILRDRLQAYPGRTKLPSVRSLMKRFQVSQHTVMSALRVLEAEKLIARKQGSGVYASQSTRPKTICFCRPQEPNIEHDRRETALQIACTSRGWKLVVDRFNPREANLFSDEVEADGFVLLPELVTFQSPLLNRLLRQGVPVVILGRDTGGAGLDFATGDDSPVIREFVTGLAKLGHRKLAFLNSEPPFYEVQKRVDYFREACRMLELEEGLVLNAGAEYGFDSLERCEIFLREYLRNLGRKGLPFTALVTGSLAGSVPAPRVFHEAGYVIPRDLSLCCIGSDQRAKYTVPPLSNASSHHPELAEASLGIIEKRLAGDKSPLLFERVQYRAIWRDSAGAPPKGRKRKVARGRKGRVKGV